MLPADAQRSELATGLWFAKGRLILELDDPREELIGPGKGFYWKSLDLDLSVRGIVSGLPEVIPAPPPRASLRPAKRSA